MKNIFFISLILISVSIFGQTKSSCTVGNCDNGYGTYVWGSDSKYEGDKYTGYWKDGLREGEGTYYWSSGAKYVGSNHNNQFEGFGILYYSNGDKFEGYFKNSKRNGSGTYTYANGEVNKGTWVDDEYSNSVTSGCVMGNCSNGYGVYVWENGERYEGNWKNDKRNGNGTNYFISGEKYVGDWVDDFRNGYGTNYYKDGTSKTGNWKNDLYQGTESDNNNNSNNNHNNLPNNINKSSEMIASGTGFAFSQAGYIATNYHVIEGGTKFLIKGINENFSKSYDAEVIITDKINDLAILKISENGFSLADKIPYVFKSSQSEPGINVFALGYPLRATMGDEIKLTNGIISSKSGFKGDITTYQISVPVQPGNSGGPLFDEEGKFIGVVNAKHTGAENVSYAIKCSYLQTLIESISNPPTLNSTSDLTNKALPEKVKILKKFVYIIETY